MKIIYSPLHGVGATAVVPALEKDGFADVEVFASHAKPDGDFPNVPGHVSNPENPAVFDAIIERAKEAGADVAFPISQGCAYAPRCPVVLRVCRRDRPALERCADDDRLVRCWRRDETGSGALVP